MPELLERLPLCRYRVAIVVSKERLKSSEQLVTVVIPLASID